MTFEPKVIGLLYYTYLYNSLGQDLSADTNIFDLVALTLTLTYFWKNLNWLPRGVLVPLGQTPIFLFNLFILALLQPETETQCWIMGSRKGLWGLF